MQSPETNYNDWLLNHQDISFVTYLVEQGQKVINQGSRASTYFKVNPRSLDQLFTISSNASLSILYFKIKVYNTNPKQSLTGCFHKSMLDICMNFQNIFHIIIKYQSIDTILQIKVYNTYPKQICTDCFQKSMLDTCKYNQNIFPIN